MGVNRKRIGLWLDNVGVLIGLIGFLLTAAIVVVSPDAPRGTWAFSLETAGLVLLSFGVVLASVGAILRGWRWPDSPIK